MFWPQEIIVEVAEKLIESNGILYMRNVCDIIVVGQMSNKYSANTVVYFAHYLSLSGLMPAWFPDLVHSHYFDNVTSAF